MKAWENFAFIKDGKVENIGCFAVGGYTNANQIAAAVYGDGAFAVDVTYIPTQAGDTFADGVFYRDGAIITAYPTEEEQLAAHETAIDDLTIAILEG